MRQETDYLVLTVFFKAIAVHDYNPQRSDELKIRDGDTIDILHKESEHWYIGRLLSGEMGYIPTNYITLLGISNTQSTKKKK